MKKYLPLLLIIAALTGCDSKPPITVELGQNEMWGSPQLQITSKKNEVTINSVEVNRGNCKRYVWEDLPHKMTFGEVLKVDSRYCQKVVEVSISTSEGDYSFSFDS
ncbi:TPA: hypothetical protein ACGW3T_002512 [Pseudomonas aeruginosa]